VQTGIILFIGLLAQTLPAQVSAPPGTALVINLTDALTRARTYGSQVQSANLSALLAAEDRKIARSNALPAVNGFNQFIYTQGNGTPSGVFVGANGVHEYGEQVQVHQDLLAIGRRGEIRRAAALEAAAKARVDIAGRGLSATVTQDYYAIVSAMRRVKNAQTSADEARRFLDITQKQELGGEVAHADVIKAQIQVQQRDRDLQEARLNIEKSKIALGVLIFPDLQQEYSIVDDLSTGIVLPPLPEAESLVKNSSPDLRAAQASLLASKYDISIAKYGYLPSFNADFYYGLDANEFAASSANAPDSGRSTLPNYLVANRQNLGYQALLTLNIPLWNWGATRSKVRQAELRQEQARLDLSVTQRQLHGNLAAFYKEAQLALAQLPSLRESSELSAESLRLTVLRYQAGEAAALEVVDAQNTAALARNAYDDGLLRYRVAIANLQTLMGTF
jgi:outer membrane protein TolC